MCPKELVECVTLPMFHFTLCSGTSNFSRFCIALLKLLNALQIFPSFLHLTVFHFPPNRYRKSGALFSFVLLLAELRSVKVYP